MDNNKYLNYYVEILTGTMTDAVIRNISLQANARVTEGVVNEQSKKIEELITKLESVQIGKNQETESKINNLENSVKGHLDTINNLTSQLAELNKMKSEYENIKHQANHVDTFRNELNKEREEHQKTRTVFENQIKELASQIEYLQLTPAKRKKLEDERNKVVEVIEQSSVLPLTDNTIKDGGSF